MPQTIDHRPGRSRIAIVLDSLLAVLLVGMAFMALTGGVGFWLFGYFISAHRVDRALKILLLLGALRFVFFDRAGRTSFLWVPERLNPLRRRVRAWCDRRRGEVDAAGRIALWAPHTAWAFLGIGVFAIIFLHPQMAMLDGVPDIGDPVLSIWRMGWVNHWLHGSDPRTLFSPNIFYPEPLTLTYSDSMLLPAIMGAPLLAAGLHPVVAYNILFMSGFVLSACAMYLLAAHLTGSPRAAFVSAILFGFYPFRFEHYSHLELQMTMWMPLALLAIHRFLRTQQMKYAIAAALAVVAQLYSSMYFGVFFCLYLVPVTALLWLISGAPIRRISRGAAVAAVLAAALAIPLARPYVAAQSRKGERDSHVVLEYSATLKDYVSPNIRSLAWDGVLPHPDPERGLFPGAMAVSLSAISLVPPLGGVRLAYTAGLLVAFEVSRGFHGFAYPKLYEWFSFIRGMRVPARFSLIVGMTLALLSAYGTQRVLHRARSGGGRTVLFVALLGGLVFDLRSHLFLERLWREPPAIYSVVEGRTDVVLAEFPWWSDRSDIGPNFPEMYFSLWHWANMVNGASGFEPPRYQQFLQSIHLFPDSAAVDALKARGVTHVTVNCAIYGADRDCHGVIEQLDHSDRFREVASARWEGDVVKMYALVK
jgi:hypothetical protein